MSWNENAQLQTEHQLKHQVERINSIAEKQFLSRLIGGVKATVVKELDVWTLTEALRRARNVAPDSSHYLTQDAKIEVWSRLKCLAFARAVGAVGSSMASVGGRERERESVCVYMCEIDTRR